ncbi:bifunctional cobalt-precorrin-7 (C(5))-methyltransferase/cobalt-precorrin-6B (C(15))-methyltransferase [Hoyosella subflava]|uniref:Precorrin-6Y C5,15-methyltransferase n=1 Tax=Hoyosella subflava (strain DSM 45089 / JCM 17490 / NBRC 109087 / DQS3-9A1) TaxID=443218 RepID=F6EP09_HOYSD|nr:bifunctional cobalt-precorrin-7 (C(5))-methyltransferase/cobalt-precorrin-6B (C(15))-methyltransferase [Hoyosella subflava]AEF40475.1 Precorrin-6Y C5,15-methyltransferase [Hoyosella subflava DQS3-9A1]
MTKRIAVVGIGADGWAGLSAKARHTIEQARVLVGSGRQLALVPDLGQERIAWPSPLMPALPGLLHAHRDSGLCVLASGDPMFHGIGVTLARIAGPEGLNVVPHVSSASLACARLGWPLHETPVVSLVNRDVSSLVPELTQGRKLLVLSEDEHTPAEVAKLLTGHGYGSSLVTVLERLGGPDEHVVEGTAQLWSHGTGHSLNIVAIEVAGTMPARLTRIPGLPDAVYGEDGQLTKQEMRALTLSALAPAPGELLWDVGAGSGSIAIEWMRSHPLCRAVAFESDADRVPRIKRNAEQLGVPGLVIAAAAPQSFSELAPRVAAPDAIMVGGGVTQDGLLDACWSRLPPGGRMVVNAVTAQSETLLLDWFTRCGGSMRKLQVYRAAPLGEFTAWRPQLPGTQWIGTKP